MGGSSALATSLLMEESWDWELVWWAALCWEELSMEEEVTHVDADEDVRLMMARLTPDSLVLRTCWVVATTVAAIVEDSLSRGVSVTTISPSETGMETSMEHAGELTTLAEPGATLMEDVLMVNHPQDSLTIPGHIKPVITMENKKYLILFQNSVDFVMLTCYSFLCLM